MAGAMHLFAYGTLMDPEIMQRVCGARYRAKKATLHGYVRKLVRGQVYPAIIGEAGSCVDGMVYLHLPAQVFARLDAFEGPLYTRSAIVAVCGNGDRVAAQTYVIKAGYAQRLSDQDWSYPDFARIHGGLFKT